MPRGCQHRTRAHPAAASAAQGAHAQHGARGRQRTCDAGAVRAVDCVQQVVGLVKHKDAALGVQAQRGARVGGEKGAGRRGWKGRARERRMAAAWRAGRGGARRVRGGSRPGRAKHQTAPTPPDRAPVGRQDNVCFGHGQARAVVGAALQTTGFVWWGKGQRACLVGTNCRVNSTYTAAAAPHPWPCHATYSHPHLLAAAQACQILDVSR